jgi:hypothetical protein
MREQVDYLIGARPFPVPDSKARPVDYQGKLVDIIVWWTANGQDGPGWRWIASTDEQLAALEEITRAIKTPTPTTLPSTRPADPDLATRIDVLRSETAAALEDIRAENARLKAQADANTAFLNAVRAAATQPATQRTQQP